MVLTLAIEAPDGAQGKLRWPGRSALITSLVLLFVLALAGPYIFATASPRSLSSFLWQRQDLPVLIALLSFLLFFRDVAPKGPTLLSNLAPWKIGLAALLLLSLAWSGHYWLMAGYDLSRDEQMALFDADIIAHGHMVASIPLDWAATADALNRDFTLPLFTESAWVSAYLPGNAALHALVGQLGDAHATAPLLVAIALIALYSCARQLWPNDTAPQLVALMCLLLSAQSLITAMTTYAMTAHLAFNLLWLAMFLRNRWWSFVLLLPIGFVATGLHQPIFHPLFVTPFLWLLMERKQWQKLAFLVVGYAAIGLFWLGWPSIVTATAGGTATGNISDFGYLWRVIANLGSWKDNGLWLMALNLLRFVAWQHLLLFPLVFAAVAAGWRSNGLVRALALGPVLTIAAMVILLPYQGHSWGYRYLHGLIGNLSLLAGFGWLSLKQNGWDRRRLILWSSAASFVVLLWLAWNVHQMVAPFASVDRQIAKSKADYVLIDDMAAPYAKDLAYNPPYLERHPVRLVGSALLDGDWTSSLCVGKYFSIVDHDSLAPINRLFGQPPATSDSEEMIKARERLVRLGCVETEQ